MSSKTGPVSRSQRIGWAKVALLVAGVVVYQTTVYFMTFDQPHGVPGQLLAAAPALAGALGLLSLGSRGPIVLLTAAGMLGFLAWRGLQAYPGWFYPVSYVTLYLALLWIFGRTLLPGRRPLITLLATHVHGGIPPEVERYTRRVTAAWCCFFAAMTVTSMLLFLFAPLALWSAFNSLLNLPLVVAMYLGEYAWRLWRHPDFSHASIATVLRAARTFDFKRAAGR
jgi:uncharacterized membrane protein